MEHLPATDTNTLNLYEWLTVFAEKEKVGPVSRTRKRIFTIPPGVIEVGTNFQKTLYTTTMPGD